MIPLNHKANALPEFNTSGSLGNSSNNVFGTLSAKRNRYAKAIRLYYRLLLKKKPLLRMIAIALAGFSLLLLLFVLISKLFNKTEVPKGEPQISTELGIFIVLFILHSRIYN
jgi:hypothetical protein